MPPRLFCSSVELGGTTSSTILNIILWICQILSEQFPTEFLRTVGNSAFPKRFHTKFYRHVILRFLTRRIYSKRYRTARFHIAIWQSSHYYLLSDFLMMPRAKKVFFGSFNTFMVNKPMDYVPYYKNILIDLRYFKRSISKARMPGT